MCDVGSIQQLQLQQYYITFKTRQQNRGKRTKQLSEKYVNKIPHSYLTFYRPKLMT